MKIACRPSRGLGALLLVSYFSAGVAGEATQVSFGALRDGRDVQAVDLTNHDGMSVRVITLGATIQSLIAPDRNHHPGDVVLGFRTPQEYVDHAGYFGATVGRFANRIARGRFSLHGHVYQLSVNDRGNHLHGGDRGFDKVLWTIDSVAGGPSATAVMSYVSQDGEEGYPGTLRVTATFSLDEHDALEVDYRATTDKTTIVNVSNHSYFNLASNPGGATALDHILQVNASRYTPVDAQLIPTGEIRKVDGSPFDFRHPTRVGLRVRDGHDDQLRHGRGYDHNFVLEGTGGQMRLAARIVEPGSGRVMEIVTSAPGLQFYSGNFLDGTVTGKEGWIYREGDALVLEPQVFPDAPNHPNFPSAELSPGATYLNRIIYRFSTAR
jgi:aldose 1-epimerase